MQKARTGNGSAPSLYLDGVTITDPGGVTTAGAGLTTVGAGVVTTAGATAGSTETVRLKVQPPKAAATATKDATGMKRE